MHIRMGWSGETSANIWQRVDVQLDQEDLIRILRENDLPTELAERLPTRVLFQLVQNEAEFLLLSKLKTLGFPAEQFMDRQGELVGSTGEIIDAIKNQLAPG